MEPGTQEFRQGVNVTDNTGQGNLLQEIPTNLIGFYDCTFIDCHRALTVGRGFLHQGIDQLDVVGCRFLYPRASNSTSKDGGGQVALAGCDVENLNCINSYAEGCDESGVNSPNGLPKDGFWFGTGRRTLIDGCTLKRFWVEGIYVLDLEPGLYVEKVVIPEVGEVVEIPIARGTDPKLLELFPVGTAVYLNKRNGYYNVERIGSFSLTLRRLPQPSPMVPGPKGGEEVKGIFCKRTGTTDDISTTVTGCAFEGGAIAGMPTDRDGLDPAVRVNAGELILEGNTFSNAQKTLLLFQDEANPNSQNGSNASPEVYSNNSISVTGGYDQRSVTNPTDLLPQDQNSEWAALNPVSQGNVAMPDLLNYKDSVYVDSIGQSLRNPNYQLRSDPIIPKSDIGPWNQSTIEPDLMRVPLEVGSSIQSR
jgi:hypothetical protein